MASLSECLLVSQEAVHVEHDILQDDGTWRFPEANGKQAVIDLPSIGYSLVLAEVYEKTNLLVGPSTGSVRTVCKEVLDSLHRGT